jgi:hypothetical protein
MNPDFSSSLNPQKNNFYKYPQNAYGGMSGQNAYSMQTGAYGSYPNYYDYSAYGYQPYYQQANQQYAYPYNYQSTQVPGYDQNAQYQQLLMQSLAGQQGYPQGTIPGAQTDLTAQYQQASVGYPNTAGYGYDYSQAAMYQIGQQQMPMGQGNLGIDMQDPNKKMGEEKK